MRGPKRGFAVGTTELLTPDARRDALRGLMIAMLPTEAPLAMRGLADVFDRQRQVLREGVTRALLVEVDVDAVGKREATYRETELRVLGNWTTVRGLTEGTYHPAQLRAEDLEELRPRFATAVEDLWRWASNFGLGHDFFASAAWGTLFGWAQINAPVPMDRFTSGSHSAHLDRAARLELPAVEVCKYNPLVETREAFLEGVSEYVEEVEKAIIERYPDLVRRPKKAVEQVRWYIRYQVLRMPYAKIAELAKRDKPRKDGFDVETIQRAVARFRHEASLKGVQRAWGQNRRRLEKPEK
jgi:hypothetical protein